MRRLAAIPIAVLLLMPATASAKEIASVKICGANDCNGVKRADVQIFIDIGDDMTGPPKAATPFFRVEVTVDAEGADRNSWSMSFVPHGELLLAGDESGGRSWFRTPPEMVAAIKRAAHGLEAFPVSEWEGPLAPARTSAAAPEPPASRALADDGPPYGPIAAILAAVVGTAAALLTLRRRRGTALG